MLFDFIKRFWLINPTMHLFPPIGGGGAATKYSIANSLRFRLSNNAYASRTFGTTGNRKTFTVSMRGKLGQLNNGSSQQLFSTNYTTSGPTSTYFYFTTGGQLAFNSVVAGSIVIQAWTNAVFRDPTSHLDILLSIDTTQATNSNGVKIFVNGEPQALTFTAYTQNHDTSFSTAAAHFIGTLSLNGTPGTQNFDGLISDINFIDGQALTPSSFGEKDSNGVWVPKPYSGSYGTNGFYLPFNDGTNLTTLGQDRSGNGNNWTLNNFSLTPGGTYDWLTDTPTNNFCTLNPLRNASDCTFSDANLKLAYGSSSSITPAFASMGMSSGEYWWTSTITANSSGSTSALIIGISQMVDGLTNYPGFNSTLGWGYYGDTGAIYNNGSTVATGASFGVGDVIGCKFNATTGTMQWYKQTAGAGSFVLQATVNSIPSGTYFPAWGDGGAARTGAAAVNFGQQPLSDTAWIGSAKSLCTANMPSVAIPNPKKHFDILTWLGNGAQRNITGTQFPVEFASMKARDRGYSWGQYDIVRGATKKLSSNSTGAEVTDSQGLNAFLSNGFSLGTDAGLNESGSAGIAHCWKAGGTAVTNTAGSITSQVSANVDAGFSIVTYTGNLTTTGASTIGHGLGRPADLIIGRSRNVSGVDNGNWFVQGKPLGVNGFLRLNTTDVIGNTSGTGGGTLPLSTSSVFSVTWNSGAGISGNNYVAYCFAEIPGYSKISSYVGNGSADGPFVYCGFRPRWILLKRIDVANSWFIHDTVRNTTNPVFNYLLTDSSAAEAGTLGGNDIDITSNGFKVRNSNNYCNANGGTYLIVAFAEHPFGGSNVAPAPAR